MVISQKYPPTLSLNFQYGRDIFELSLGSGDADRVPVSGVGAPGVADLLQVWPGCQAAGDGKPTMRSSLI
jgi:hypothetical protein